MSRDWDALGRMLRSDPPPPPGWRGVALNVLSWTTDPLVIFLHRRINRIRNGPRDVWWWLALVPAELVPALWIWLRKPELERFERARVDRLRNLTRGTL
jgi:hypothetical protein